MDRRDRNIGEISAAEQAYLNSAVDGTRVIQGVVEGDGLQRGQVIGRRGGAGQVDRDLTRDTRVDGGRYPETG